MKSRLATALIVWLLFSGAAGFAVDLESIEELSQNLGLQALPEGTKAPDFELESTDGTMVKLSSYQGKVVFLNFWATWCPPCRAEMPSMQELYEQFSDKGLVMLAVDLQESKEKVIAFMEEFKLDFPAILDVSGRVGRKYGVRSIPTTYLIDPGGDIIVGAIGAREWSSPEAIKYFTLVLDAEIGD